MQEIKLVKPQLASSDVPDIYTQITWPKLLQPKLDGICCLAVNGRAMSRTMKPIANQYVQKIFKELGLHGTHGELMVKGDFNDVQSAIMKVNGEPNFYYVIYDMWDSEDIYSSRFSKVVEYVLSLNNKHIALIDEDIVQDAPECETKLKEYTDAGYEGGMLRDPNSLYKQGRHTLKSQALMKLKKFYDDEAIIIGFEEKMHNENEQVKDERGYSKRSSHKENMVPADTLGALVVKWKDVEFKIGSGYNDKQRKDIWNRRGDLLGKLTTFKFQELSKYSIPRFPVWKCIREEFND